MAACCSSITLRDGRHLPQGDPVSASLETVLRHAFEQNLLHSTDTPSAMLFDLDRFLTLAQSLKSAFPSSALHTVAVKAFPVAAFLREAAVLGLGAEAASVAELHHALACGFPPSRIVFDSPCKTQKELEFALRSNVHINVDNFDELEVVAKLLQVPQQSSARSSRIGLRIAPGVKRAADQSHTPSASSTEGKRLDTTWTGSSSSKFGVNLQQYRVQIFDAFRRYPWLNALHVHVGSQSTTLESMAAGAAAVVDLANELNAELGRRIEWIDIGGGLPVDYNGEEDSPSFAAYYRQLQQTVPAIAQFNLITEFGRSLVNKAGTYVSVVQYAKVNDQRHMAVIMGGADLFIREAYLPDIWQHRVAVFRAPEGKRRGFNDGLSLEKWDIVGPLCFSGDTIARDVYLPSTLERLKDWVVICDVGGYTLSMHSRYNCRPTPQVLAYKMDGQSSKATFWKWKEEETLDQILSVWQSPPTTSARTSH